MMFLFKVKKVVGWAITALSLMCLLGSASVYAADNTVSSSKVHIHKNSSGGKGRDTVVLIRPPQLAENTCALFVSAQVKYDKKRWGESEIKSLPKRGCNPDRGQCNVVVSWKQAPLGYLHYWVEARWTVKSSGC
uniref:Uncharacterized protein n=1 Tax=uncultured Thiotrichaceae bacterium TaxID=298394 RepID=A0A6S6S4D3_9GAMM|nr:MAG: Unknown protein [uncultured Thiotrichaceae bacterium]